jgi:uncharacterized membrane protein YdjX (TVP38/TMEM64 family)
MRNRWVKRVLLGAAVLGLLFLLWSVWDHDAILRWLERARPLPFFALMALLPMLGLPLTPFFVIAGATFGIALGALGSISALAANLFASYLIGRWLRPSIAALLKRLGYELPDFTTRQHGALRFTLAVKLAPGVPAFVKTYGLAVAGVRFGWYFGVSMLITGAYGISIIVLGDSLFDHDRQRVVLALGVLVVLAVGVWAWRRRLTAPLASRD